MRHLLQGLKVGAAIAAFAGLVAIVWTATALPTIAQSPPPVSSLRLYVLDCGVRLNADPAEGGMPGPGLDRPTPCFLIVHPKGTLMWETGTNEHAPHSARGFNPTKSVMGQLEQIGYAPSKVTYLALSHYHGDHAGNANYFTDSTWLVEKDMRGPMFGPWPYKTAGGAVMPEPDPNKKWDKDKRPYEQEPIRNMKDWDKLKSVKTVIIPNKDYDVFGDGSVVILDTPAFTPGHMSLLVNLPKTGPVVIGGDIYTDVSARQLFLQYTHRKLLPNMKPYAQVEINTFLAYYVNGQGGSPMSDWLASMGKVEDIVEKRKAQLWVQHDMVHFKQLKKSPEYYE